MGDWTANPHRCRYGCADGIRNYQLYGLRARDILNHQLKREGCAEGMALSFWCEKVAKVAKLQVALRFFSLFLHIVSRIFRKKHYLCSRKVKNGRQ
jgi:hypothetical protein